MTAGASRTSWSSLLDDIPKRAELDAQGPQESSGRLDVTAHPPRSTALRGKSTPHRSARPGWQPSSVNPAGNSVKIAMSESMAIASGKGSPRAVCP